MKQHPRSAKVRELAAPFGLADAPWDYFDTRPEPHQLVVIVGEYVHGKPVLEAAQYDGINFFGWLGGRHNQQTWAWLDAGMAAHIRFDADTPLAPLPNLGKQYRPRHS